MSFFHKLFSPLLSSSPSFAIASPRRKELPSFGVPGLHADGQLSPGVNFSTSPRLVPIASGKFPSSSRPLVYAENVHGLSTLVAKVAGLGARLGFLSRPGFTNTTNVAPQSTIIDREETPLSSASGTLPDTPRNEQPLLERRCAPCFARATPPKVQWRPTSVTPSLTSCPAEIPLFLQGIPAQPGLNAPVCLRSSPRLTSFLDLDDLNEVSEPHARLDDWLSGTTHMDWVGGGSPSDWLPQAPRSPLGSTHIHKDPDVIDTDFWASHPFLFPDPASPRSEGARSLVPTEPAQSPRPSIAAIEPTVSPFGSAESSYFGDWTHPDAIPTPPLIDPYNSDREKHPDVVEHRGTSYHVIGMLGEGSYGRVMLAVTNAAEVVALKVVHKRKVYREAGIKETLPIERDCLAAAADKGLPFWVQLRAAWEDNHNLYYAMETCMGTLRDRIANANHACTPLRKDEVRLMCAEMLLAIRDLRELELVHSDIKPENFLITRQGKVVLSDFGFAQGPSSKLHDPRAFLAWLGTPGGTSGYLAPEALEDGYCCHHSDIYSLGIVFMELMAGMSTPVWDTAVMPPAFSGGAARWDRVHPSQRQAWLVRNVKFDTVSESALPRDSLEWDLCMQMLRRDPSTGELGAPQRSVEDLLAHPYFAGLNFEAIYQGWVRHDYIPDMNMDHFRIDKDKRDLTFEKWHRGAESRELYDPAVVFRPFVVGGAVVKSNWLVDSVNVAAQIAGPLERFEWP